MASKIAIMSRGVTPSALSDEATFSTVVDSARGMSDDFCSVTSVLVRGVTTVCPPVLKAVGWET